MVRAMDLRTARLLLRELTLDDAPATNAYERDPEVMRYQGDGVRTLEQSRAAIEKLLPLALEQPRRIYDLALCREGALIGRVGFGLEVDEHRSDARLWYIQHPAHGGQGYVHEACVALLGLAFDTLSLHRVYADIDPRNAPSVRVVERLGFRREGHFRANYRTRGEWTDSVFYALLEDEWRAR
jgi:RimJ/RimL family protein N-acetyltransferase